MNSYPQTDYPLSVNERHQHKCTCGLFLMGNDCLLLKISVQECMFTVLLLEVANAYLACRYTYF